MFDFGIFCHLLRLMGIYRVGLSGYLKSFLLSFLFCLFFFFFSILHFLFLLSFFLFFVSLSRAPLAPGPLDIVHPCHPIATPLHPSCTKLLHRSTLVCSVSKFMFVFIHFFKDTFHARILWWNNNWSACLISKMAAKAKSHRVISKVKRKSVPLYNYPGLPLKTTHQIALFVFIIDIKHSQLMPYVLSGYALR